MNEVVKVKPHSRGISVEIGDRLARSRLFRLIEEKVGFNNTIVVYGQLILPKSAAVDLLEVIGTDKVLWDASILSLALEQKHHRELQLNARIDVTEAIMDPIAQLEDFRLLNRLDPHQVEAVAAICVPSLRGMALFDEQGTGKTITSLAAFDRLHDLGTVARLLVIAPKSVLAIWESECNDLFGDRYRISMVSGSSRNRKELIQKPHDILLIGYEGLVRELGLIKMVIKIKPQSYMLVIDESYFVKNPETARALAIAEIRPFCERALVLCGTPAPNAPIDIVNQINIADGGVAFANVEIPDNREDERRIIHGVLETAIYLRRLKENVLTYLPSKQFEKVFIDLQPVQRKLYNNARKELVLAVRMVDDQEFSRKLQSFLARRMLLLQICSHPGALDPLYYEEPAKLIALDKLIKELIDEKGKKVVIWGFFRYSVRMISERYKQYGLVRIDGSVTRLEDRINAIKKFQNDPHTHIFVGNAGAAGAGITLTAAHHAIYESFSNQASHYMQSIDRIHRRGQLADVNYHVILSKDTIEEPEFERIKSKERSQHDLLGDEYQEPMTKERFLFELGERT